MHQEPSCCFAINPAVNQRPGHRRQSYLNALEIAKQVRYLAIRLASAAHLGYRFGQHNPPLQVPAKRHRLLRGVRIAYLRALFSRCLALLAIPEKQLASPVIAVPRLWHSAEGLSVFRTVDTFHHFRFPIPAITNFGNSGNLPCPTPLGLNYDSKGLIPSHPSNSV
jgi:hypothetical protein